MPQVFLFVDDSDLELRPVVSNCVNGDGDTEDHVAEDDEDGFVRF